MAIQTHDPFGNLIIPRMVRPLQAGKQVPSSIRNTINFHALIPAAASAVQSQRTSFFSDRITAPSRLQTIRPKFAINTQRLLRLRFWITYSQTTVPISPTGEMPTGRNLMANSLTGNASAVDYIVGDGEAYTPINRRADSPEGVYLCVDAENVDTANIHTLDVEMEVELLPRLVPWEQVPDALLAENR